MRAVFLSDKEFNTCSTIEIEGEDFHHLKNVLRVKENTELLLLNGHGEKAEAHIKEVNKKSYLVEILKITKSLLPEIPSLGLCLPKKEYFESALRSCVELGVRDLYLFDSEFSQRFELNEKRISTILKSSYEQSNNPFELKIHSPTPLSDLASSSFQKIIYFNSQSADKRVIESKARSSDLIVIGPEGGFSDLEQEFLSSLKNGSEACLTDRPIMRSVTAIPFAFGHLMH